VASTCAEGSSIRARANNQRALRLEQVATIVGSTTYVGANDDSTRRLAAGESSRSGVSRQHVHDGLPLSPTVAADSSGNFVVGWQSYPQNGSNFGVFGQRCGRIVPVELVRFSVE
jgi:hypothetical protein